MSPRSKKKTRIPPCRRTATARPLAERMIAECVIFRSQTFLVRRRHYHDRLVAVHRGIGHAAKPEVDNAHDMLRPCRSAWAPWSC